MLQLHVLIHGSFRAVRLVAAFDGALVVTLDLRCSASMPLPLVIPRITPLVVHLVHRGHSIGHGGIDICLHLRHTIIVDALSDIVHLVNVVLAMGLDRLTAKHGLLHGSIVSPSAASTSTARLAASLRLEGCRVRKDGIHRCFIFVLNPVDQLLTLFYQLLIPVG